MIKSLQLKWLTSSLGALLWLLSLAIPGYSQNPIPPNLGAAAGFGLLSGSNIISNTDLHVLGAVGAYGSISSNIIADSSKFANNSNPVPAAISDLTAARTYCNNL